MGFPTMTKKKNHLTDLKSLVEFASRQAEKIFRQTGVIYPMYHAIKPDGDFMILPAPEGDKDTSVGLIKAAFAIHAIDRYVFIDEGWILDQRLSGGAPLDLARIARTGLRDHPDRREVLLFLAENRRGERQTGSRYILRPEHGRASLAPLKLDDMTGLQSSGRMIGLLNPLQGG
jgi:hypothetical protein